MSRSLYPTDPTSPNGKDWVSQLRYVIFDEVVPDGSAGWIEWFGLGMGNIFMDLDMFNQSLRKQPAIKYDIISEYSSPLLTF